MWHLGHEQRPCVCIFSTLIIWELNFKFQTSFEAHNFVLPLFLSLHSSSSSFKLLSMTSYGGELLLNSSSPWSGISNHLSSFSILLPWSSRSKGLHWWRRSKSYKLHMELNQGASVDMVSLTMGSVKMTLEKGLNSVRLSWMKSRGKCWASVNGSLKVALLNISRCNGEGGRHSYGLVQTCGVVWWECHQWTHHMMKWRMDLPCFLWRKLPILYHQFLGWPW